MLRQQEPSSVGALLILAVFLMVPLVACVMLSIRWLNGRERRESRGFEVKLNTGDEPVTEKKENDHG